MKNLLSIVLVVLLNGCLPCNTVTVENGALPGVALKFVPYQNGETYKFKHSNGLVIDFYAQRETLEEWSRCTECCGTEYHFEINATKLTPDYPVFDFYFEISNRDTSYLDCYALIGKYTFYIPSTDFQSAYFERVDSMMIDSVNYTEVFKLKSNYGAYYDNDSIYADSLFYNYEHGILKIMMSNGENYEIVK